MKRRDFLKLAAIAIIESALDLLDLPVMSEEWILSVDDDLLREAVTVNGVYPGSGRVKPYADVTVDTEKLWSAITLTDAQGIAYYTADGELWHDENGVLLDVLS